MSIDPERYVTDLEEQVDTLIRERDEARRLMAVDFERARIAEDAAARDRVASMHAEERSERWRLLAMGWKHRCYTAGDALTDIAILHMQRPCSHGSEPHEPKRAPNGEVWCSGPHCRACGVVAPCGTYLLATRSGGADRP